MSLSPPGLIKSFPIKLATDQCTPRHPVRQRPSHSQWLSSHHPNIRKRTTSLDVHDDLAASQKKEKKKGKLWQGAAPAWVAMQSREQRSRRSSQKRTIRYFYRGDECWPRDLRSQGAQSSYKKGTHRAFLRWPVSSGRQIRFTFSATTVKPNKSSNNAREMGKKKLTANCAKRGCERRRKKSSGPRPLSNAYTEFNCGNYSDSRMCSTIIILIKCVWVGIMFYLRFTFNEKKEGNGLGCDDFITKIDLETVLLSRPGDSSYLCSAYRLLFLHDTHTATNSLWHLLTSECESCNAVVSRSVLNSNTTIHYRSKKRKLKSDSYDYHEWT